MVRLVEEHVQVFVEVEGAVGEEEVQVPRQRQRHPRHDVLRPAVAAGPDREKGVEKLGEEGTQGALGDDFALSLVRQSRLDLQWRQLLAVDRVFSSPPLAASRLLSSGCFHSLVLVFELLNLF